MGYTLPVAVDTYTKMFAVPDAQIPTGLVTTAGLPFLQFNTHRIAIWIQNRGAGSVVFISEKEFGFGTAFALDPAAVPFYWEWPPRTQVYCWKTGTSDLRYMEQIYQPQRQGVGTAIRSNVQNP